MRIIFLAGLITVVSVCGCSKPIHYERYSSKDVQIDFAMDYVAGWSHNESRDANGGFVRIIFTEPLRKGRIPPASMVVTVRDFPAGENASPSFDSFVDAELARRQKLKGMKLLFKASKKSVLGDSVSLEIAYQRLSDMSRADAWPMPTRDKTVILKRSGKLYTFEYTNAELNFAALSGAFDHCLQSIEFERRSNGE